MQIVYSFHMPLMFIISGYLLNLDRPLNLFIRNKAKRLLLPYIVCCAVLVLLKTFIAWIRDIDVLQTFLKWSYISLYGSGSGSGSLYVTLSGEIKRIEEIGMLWYLLALFWGSMLLHPVMRSRYPLAGVMGISATGILTSQFIWLPFSLQNGMAIVFWLYIGVMLKENQRMDRIEEMSAAPFALCLVLWFVSAVYGKTWLFQNRYGLGLIDIAGAVAGSFAVIRISKWITGHIQCLRTALAYAGINSMGFYAVHFWEDKLYPLTALCNALHIGKNNILLSTLLIVLLCVISLNILNRISYIRSVLGSRS